MKRFRKFFVLAGVLALAYAAYIGVSLAFLPSVGGLADRKSNMTIQVKDWKGNLHPFVVGPRTTSSSSQKGTLLLFP